MSRWLIVTISLTVLVGAAYIGTEQPQLREQLQNYLPTQEVRSFEAKYTPEQIVQRYQKQVSNKGASYDAPELELYPYLLMDVKYVKSDNSYEGQLLWSLCDGEIVLNTQQWTSSHGYDDCLAARATRDEMRVVHALAQHGGQLDRSGVLESLKQDAAQVDEWLEHCRKKQLVTQTGNHWKLHMQHPLFCLEPITPIKEMLVNRPMQSAKLMAARYRDSQLLELAKAAFGQNFAIKRYESIYLPVYSLTFKYADGSKRTLRFNAYSNTLFP